MFNINTSVLGSCGYTAAELEAAVKAIKPAAAFNDYQAFIDAESKYGIRADYLAAHASVESDYGIEQIAANNIFGFNADDSNPAGDASSFASQAACIDYVANFLKVYYLTTGGSYYHGSTLHDIFIDYSSSHDAEATTVAEVMNLIAEHISAPAPAPAPQPAPAPAGNTYHVVSGDTLSAIIEKYPGTTVAGFVSANKSKYPNITANFIEAGWDLIVPSGSAPAPAPAPSEPVYRTVVAGDTLSAYEAEGDASPAQVVEWNKSRYPAITENFIEVGWTLRVR